MGCHFLLQGIFLTQGWNPHLLHWQADSLPLSQLGSPCPSSLTQEPPSSTNIHVTGEDRLVSLHVGSAGEPFVVSDNFWMLAESECVQLGVLIYKRKQKLPHRGLHISHAMVQANLKVNKWKAQAQGHENSRIWSPEAVRVCVHTCPLNRFRVFGTPWTVARQAPLSIEFSRQEYWSGLPFPSPGDLPDPAIELVSLISPASAGRFFTHWTTKGRHLRL